MGDGLRFVIANKSDVYQLEIAGVNGTADFIPNGVSTATFTLDDDDPVLPKVWADGSRCWVFFRGVERFRGRIKEVPRKDDGLVTAEVEGDTRKLWDWLGWPKPTAALTAQTSEYWRMTAAPETVVKAALSAAFTRLGVPWSCVASSGRGGASVPVELRMHPLADKLLPVLDAAGLILKLSYASNGAVSVDVRVPATVPGLFTMASGVPETLTYSRSAPTATRAVVGGRGDGTAREFKQVVDTARETAWGDIIEKFVDARNTDAGSDIAVEASQAVTDGASQVGLTVELAESPLFEYGRTYVEGDNVQVLIGPVTGTFPITGVSVVDNDKDGVVVTPRIGDASASAETDVQFANTLSQMARAIRNQGRR